MHNEVSDFGSSLPIHWSPEDIVMYLPSENPVVGANLMNLAKSFLSFNGFRTQGLSGYVADRQPRLRGE